MAVQNGQPTGRAVPGVTASSVLLGKLIARACASVLYLVLAFGVARNWVQPATVVSLIRPVFLLIPLGNSVTIDQEDLQATSQGMFLFLLLCALKQLVECGSIFLFLRAFIAVCKEDECVRVSIELCNADLTKVEDWDEKLKAAKLAEVSALDARRIDLKNELDRAYGHRWLKDLARAS